MPASAVLVAVIVATWPVLAWPLRDRFGVRAALVPPLTSLALVPLVMLGAAWAHGQPLVGPPGSGVGDTALYIVAAPITAVALVAAHAWARYIASPPGRRRVDVTLRTTAFVAIVAGTVLAATGVARSVRSPDADGWAASLPVSSTAPEAVAALAFERLGWSFYDIRRDDARDLWVATEPGPDGPFGIGRVPVLALGCALVPRNMLPRDLEGIAPPRGWVIEAAAGVLAALLSAGIGVWLARRHRRVRVGTPAEHTGGGWVSLDGARLHLSDLQTAAPGPVILRLGAASEVTYRASGAPRSVRLVELGTVEDVDDTARSIATAGYAAALAIVLLACAPLVVA